MNIDSHFNIQSNLMFDDSKSDKSSLNTSQSQQLNKFKLTNAFDNLDDPSIEENNELQIKKDLKQTRHMMRFFNKHSKSEGCFYNIILFMYILYNIIHCVVCVFRFKFRSIEFYERYYG